MKKLAILLYILVVSLIRTALLSFQTLIVLFSTSQSTLSEFLGLLLNQLIFGGITVLLFKQKAVWMVSAMAMIGLLIAGWPLAVLFSGFLQDWQATVATGTHRQLLIILGRLLTAHLTIIPVTWLLLRFQQRRKY